MNVKHLSTTLISGWALCPSRSWDGYALRNEFGDDQLSSDPTRFGNVVHDTCEEMHNLAMQGERLPDPTDLFDQFWRERDCYDLSYYGLGRDTVGEFLERTLTQRMGDTIATELHFVLDLVNGRVVLLHDFAKLDIEVLIDGIIAAGGVPVMSKIDRVDVEHTKDGGERYHIFDYKTNFLPFTQEEIRNSLQLGIYAMAAHALYPKAESITCTFDMLRHGRFPHVFPAEKLDEMRAFLVNLWHQIDGAEEARPRLNKYCNWCHKRGNCPVYQEALDATIPEILTEEYDNPEGLAFIFDQWEGLKDRKKAIESRIEELEEMLATVIIEAKGAPVKIGEREIYLSPNHRGEYSAREVFELFQRNKALIMLRDVMSISKGNMDRALRSIPFRAEVEKLLVRNPIKASLKARALKPTATEED